MQDTRRYAKRQLTWFNNRPKNAKHLGILEAENYILKIFKYKIYGWLSNTFFWFNLIIYEENNRC